MLEAPMACGGEDAAASVWDSLTCVIHAAGEEVSDSQLARQGKSIRSG